MADVIGDEFFDGSGNKNLLMSLGVFGSAFVMRPIGGMLMGHIGDTAGRKRALEISILLMLLPSFLMGCLPSYSHAKGWATFLLILLRLIQGLAVGGELVSAYVFCIESAPHDTKVFWGAMTLDACNVGSLLGIGVAAIVRASLRTSLPHCCVTLPYPVTPTLTLILSRDELHSYGWRIGFWLGLLVAVAGVMLRRGMEDTEEFKRMMSEKEAQQDEPTTPLGVAFGEHSRAMLLVSGTAAIWCTGFYTYFVWMPFLMGSAIDVEDHKEIEVCPWLLAASTCALMSR